MAARGQQYALKATLRDGSIAPIPVIPLNRVGVALFDPKQPLKSDIVQAE